MQDDDQGFGRTNRGHYQRRCAVRLGRLEPVWLIDSTQVVDPTKQQKRQNRCFRRFEAPGGYTKSEFLVRGVRGEGRPSRRLLVQVSTASKSRWRDNTSFD